MWGGGGIGMNLCWACAWALAARPPGRRLPTWRPVPLAHAVARWVDGRVRLVVVAACECQGIGPVVFLI